VSSRGHLDFLFDGVDCGAQQRHTLDTHHQFAYTCLCRHAP
jgi:hypothetical protein